MLPEKEFSDSINGLFMYFRVPLRQCKNENVPRIEVKWHWIVSLLCLVLGRGRGKQGRIQMEGEVAQGWKDGPCCF